jgi:hypothetical protein
VLWAFAFAQPLLDLLGDTPEFFVARGNTSSDIVLLALVLLLVPPLLLVSLEALVGLVSWRARQALHLALVGLLTAAFALQLIKDLSVPAGLLVALAVTAGALAALAYARTRAARSVLTVLAPVPLVFLFVFLVVSPVSGLVLGGDDVETADVEIPGRPPVVIVLFDELGGWALDGTNGRIDARRFPNFARFARNATWYRNANTVADFTDRAVPSMLTGERPDKGALPIAADHPESLFTLFGGRYSLDVTEPVTDVCPERLCPDEAAAREPAKDRLRDLGEDLSLVSLHLLLPDSLSTGLAPVDRSFGDFRGAVPQGQARAPVSAGRAFAALDAILNRVSIFKALERRLQHAPRSGHLVFFHIQMPHNPYQFLPTGQRYPETVQPLPGLVSENQPPGGAWSDDPELPHQALERYLLQIGYADRMLGGVIDALRSSGTYDRSLVAVLADHGASFMAGAPHRAAVPSNLPAIASIPLLIKSPDQNQGEINDENVDITDVLPTIADRLGVDLPWGTGGRPAREATSRGLIRLQPQVGDHDLTMPFGEFVRRRRGLVRHVQESFGPGPLQGRPLAALGVGRAQAARFELDGAGLFADVHPQGPIVPAMVSGRVSGVADDARLAVAVDGRVAAGAVRWRDGGVRRFAAIVPPSAFAQGANRVDLVAISGTGSGRQIVQIPGASVDYRLVERGDRLSIAQGNREFPVAGRSPGGFVDDVSIDQGTVKITGWAADLRRHRVADRILAFAGGRLVAAAKPSVERPDVARVHGDELGRSGFDLNGPAIESQRVRVFALYGSQAVPVPRAPRIPAG